VHRIDDWFDPWLPLPVRLFNRFPSERVSRRFPLNEVGLLEAARRATGLEDFGDASFLTPFRILVQDFEDTRDFTNLGRVSAHTLVRNFLGSRLCVEDRLKSDARISDQHVDRPILIAGLPRTGTTHLHNLLSEVRGLRYLPLWQTLAPVRSRLQSERKDSRRTQCEWQMRVARYVAPLLVRMHEMQTDMPHEELTLSALGFRSFFFEGAFKAPRYLEWYRSQDHTEGYAYLKRILRILQTEPAPGARPAGARWILKSPQHLDQLEQIFRVFPDVKLVLTHRDPARAILSLVTMILYGRRQMYHPERALADVQHWVERLTSMLIRSREQLKRLPPEQIHHVHFDAFMSDPKQTVRDILEFAGVDADPASLERIDAHLGTHSRDRHGRIDYRYEDLGIHAAEIRQRLQ